MHQVAIEKANNLKLNIKYTCKVPGIFDMPLIIDKLLQKKDVDGVVTLGAVSYTHLTLPTNPYV